MNTTDLIDAEQGLDRQALEVEERIRQRLARECPCAYYFEGISCECERQVLTVRGRLPSYELRHLLESLLRDLPGIRRVNNEVEVVNSYGLSTVSVST